ncbi:MAG: FtsQ-type POTRA domain-containing protein [Candidatus Daviesbacteria bacterium]|nr:FtsQ-type POTRA domain-containing protein [Candidatus Daviesbacteria bacterium]
MRFAKKRGSRNKFKKIFVVLGILIMLVLILTTLKSNIFVVRNLEVNLNRVNCVSEKEIKDNLQISDMNILFFDSRKILKTLQNKFPCIGSVNMQRVFPNRIKLQFYGRDAVFALKSTFLQEASIAAVLKDLIEKSASSSTQASSSAAIQDIGQSNYLLVDQSGIIFTTINQSPYVPIILYWNNNLKQGDQLDQSLTAELSMIFSKFKELNLPISEVRVYPQGTAIIPSPNIIILNLNKDLTSQLAALQLIVTQAKMSKENMVFIDLRFDKPVVKYAPRSN